MNRVIEMTKIERKHLLKHYQGGFAMVLDQGQIVTGEIEEVDMEDGSVLIHSGERSQWVDGEKVTPSLKQWKDLTHEDVSVIVNNVQINGVQFSYHDIFNVVFTKECVIVETKIGTLIIEPNWQIGTNQRKADNIGSIIFLLCELGYDVTGQFKR